MIRLKQLPPGFAPTPQKPRTASKARKRPKSPGKAPDPPEREIQAAIVGYLWTIPRSWWCRYNSGAMRDGARFIRFTSRPGHPDIAGCIAGRAVFIEVKAARGKVSPAQDDCHDDIRRGEGVVIVARSIEDVRTALVREGLVD